MKVSRLAAVWRSVQGPEAKLNGPLFRFAHLVSAHDRKLERQRILRTLRQARTLLPDDGRVVYEAGLNYALDAIKEDTK